MPRLGLALKSVYSEPGAARRVAGFTNNYSLSFDGTDDNVNIGSAAAWGDATVDFTIAVWEKSTDSSGYYVSNHNTGDKPRAQFGFYGNRLYVIYIDADGNTVVAGGNTASGHLGNPNDGNWKHVAIVIKRGDTDTLQYYHNGVVSADAVDISGQAGVAGTLAGSAMDTYIGAGGNTGTDSEFAGLINDVAMWNTALTTADLLKLYNSGVPTDLTSADSYDTDRTSNLKGYWKFEEGSGSTVADSSDEGNDGTINNATFSADVPS